MNKTDEQLIQQVAAGDVSAFDELVERYQRSVQHTILRFVADHAEAENLAQDVFIRLFESARTYEGRAQLKTWLYRIVTNVCLNHVRKQSPALSDNLAERSANSPDPPAIALESERNSIIRAAIDSLSANQRMAVILHRFDGLSYKETAEAMNCPLATVESNIHRAYLALKEKLAEYVQA